MENIRGKLIFLPSEGEEKEGVDGFPNRRIPSMADDSLEILEEHEFHPADPPQGMRNYDLGSLMPEQQRTLNEFKMIQRIENENYLKAHPEIKGLISILLRQVRCPHCSPESPSAPAEAGLLY